MGNDKTEFLSSLYDQIESQVQFGDNKASLLVAGDAILLAICGGLIQMVSGSQPSAFGVSCMVPSVPLGLSVIAAALLISSLACALVAARPSGVHEHPPKLLFLFSHIAGLEPDEFAAAYKNASVDNLVDEALVSIHGKAMYATRKFRWLRRAINATLLSLGFIVLTALAAAGARLFGA
jgi:Pycsar effector protein